MRAFKATAASSYVTDATQPKQSSPICQFNDGTNAKGTPLWIGARAIFPSTAYVLANPEACVNEMIAMYKAGHIGWWSSYSTGAYEQWLASNSPMWALATLP